MNRSYDGPALDGTVQYITERPELDEQAEDTVYATEEPEGTETTENVPVPDGGVERPESSGQTTLDEWRWSV